MFIPRVINAISVATIWAVAVSCQSTAELSDNTQMQIAFGEKVFQEKQCGKCHQIGNNGHAEQVPNLSSVFLAMDTLFVKAHLQFTEVSAMAPIAMTPHEISAVTQYIASLHAKANTPPDLQNPDGRCPICGAPLKKSEAAANHLESTYNDKLYYFECPDCKVVFQRDPAWHSQSGYVVKR